MIKLRFFIVVICIAQMIVSLAWAQQKKTVCSMTLNSDNEINLFKSHFSNKLWNFVELTEFKTDNDEDENQWLKTSCQKKVQCDILVVSGHFGGSFFGKSNLTLPLETLEQATCDKDCAGIFNKPKEVFLFGCNTLATKEKDHRTPEEYMQVLIDDGFSVTQAQQVVALRYSDLGDSFRGRMSQVFAETPRIYGYSSVGPTGDNVESSFNKYLKSSKNDYLNFENYNALLGSKTNTKLKSALSGFPIAQVMGFNLISKQNSEKPYCYLGNETVSNIDKLKYIHQTLSLGRGLTIINYIKEFIEGLQEKNYQFSAEENKILAALKSNPQVVQDFNKLVNLPGTAYLKTRYDIFALQKYLGMIDDQYYTKHILKVLDLDGKTKITIETKDLMCSLGVQADIPPEVISSENWGNHNFYNMLQCLKPRNTSMLEKLVSTLENAGEKVENYGPEHYSNEVLRTLKIVDKNLISRLFKVFMTHKNSSIRFKAGDVLSYKGLVTPEQVTMTLNFLKTVNDQDIGGFAIKALAYSDRSLVDYSQVVQQVLSTQFKDSEYGVRGTDYSLKTEAIYNIPGSNLTAQEKTTLLLKILTETGHKYQALAVVNDLRPNREFMPVVLKIAQNESNLSTRKKSIMTLKDLDKSGEYQNEMFKIFTTVTDRETLHEIRMYFSEKKLSPEVIQQFKNLIKTDTDVDRREFAAKILER